MKRRFIVGIVVIVALLISGLAVGLYFLLRGGDEDSPNAAVATLAAECTDAAVDILKRGGSAVDGAITACLCQGIVFSHSSGLGGGLVATVYIKETGTIETLNSREVAPIAAFKDMFVDERLSIEGGLAVAVPGELKGLFELHKKYGKFKWEEVVQPAVDVAENGFKVTEHLANLYLSYQTRLKSNPLFKYEIRVINLFVCLICFPLQRAFHQPDDRRVLQGRRHHEAPKTCGNFESDC